MDSLDVVAPVVGSRVVDKDGCRGTVKYLGPVATSKSSDAVYAGVEWDDSTRGKNDGAVTAPDGTLVRYFTTKSGTPTAASFMKLDLLSTGWSMAKAMGDRYLDTSDTTGNSLTGTSGKEVPILLVGDAQIRAAQTLGKLTAASLRGCGVVSIPRGNLTGLCAKLREVDLRTNLLSSWSFLAELGAALPSLRTLNVGDNPLGRMTSDQVQSFGIEGALPQLRTLIASETGLDWASVLCLDSVMPGLEELHVCKNGITETVGSPARIGWPADGVAGQPTVITAQDGASFFPPSSFRMMKTLNLGENPLAGWGHAYAAAHMPKLAWLQVGDCGLGELWCPPSNAAQVADRLEAAGTDEVVKRAITDSVPFALMDQLSLSGSHLSYPWCVDAIDAFPALTTVRLTNADLTSEAVAACTLQDVAPGTSASLGPSEARQLLVARCPKLAMVNGSEVRPREREDAEKGHGKTVAAAWADKMGKLYGAAPSTEGFPALVGPPRTLQDVFGPKTVVDDAVFKGMYVGTNPGVAAGAKATATTLTAPTAQGFSKGADSGVIRGRPGVDKTNPFYTSPVPLWLVSAAGARAGAANTASISQCGCHYIPELDPYQMGSSNPIAAGALQAVMPRIFMLAAKYDLLAPSVGAAGTVAGLAGSAVTITLRSMAGSSCMMEPVVRKLPVTTAVGAVKQLAARLFKVDPALARLSFRDTPTSYPSLLEDDLKPLSYYAICEGGDILIEEVDPADAARQAAAEAAAKSAKEAAQEATGEALRRAQESSVSDSRKAAAATASAKPAVAKPWLKAAIPAGDDRI